MKQPSMHRRWYCCAALLLASSLLPAWAQSRFPDAPIKMIVPFAPGGGVDTAGRLIARQLQAKQVRAQAPYDPVTDLAPVARVGEAPLLMVISPNLPEQELCEAVQSARQSSDKWTAALPAMGAPSHLATLLLAQKSNLKITTVPCKGTALARVDVADGHAQILMDSIIALLPMAKTGKVKPMVTTSAKRSAIAPDIPTAAESGMPGLVYTSWHGIWAPLGTPADRVQLLDNAVNEAVAELSRSGAFAALGVDGITDARTGARLRQVTSAPCIHHHPFFFVPAHDQAMRFLFFVSHRSGAPQLHAELRKPDGQVQVYAPQHTHPPHLRFSPDGRWVVLTSDRSGHAQVHECEVSA